MEKQVPVFQRDEAAEVCSSLSVSALSRASVRLGPPPVPPSAACLSLSLLALCPSRRGGL